MDVEVVICSASGKPIFCYERRCRRPSDAAVNTATTTASSSTSGVSTEKSSFVSSLQGLLSFIACMQHEELQQVQTNGCRCFFQTRENLTFAIVLRASAVPQAPARSGGGHDHGEDDADTVPDVPLECLQRLIQLLHSQILFVLTERGLDVLRRQPGYDLRDLLNGTERVMTALCDRWASDPALRFRDLGVSFVRLAPDQRLAITRTLEFDPSLSSLHMSSSATSSSSAAVASGGASEITASAMICGVLLARKKIVAVSQPNPKQFGVLIDDLLLLINFVYHTPSLAKSETWTPICLPSFNASGFLYAYVVFLTADICLLLLSSQQSPEQFHAFHAKKEFMAQRLLHAGALESIHNSVQSHGSWKPHGDLPLLTHFIYKNELTGECVTPELDFPFEDDDHDTNMHLLGQYAKLHHVMYPTKASAPSSGSDSTTKSKLNSQPLGKRLPGLHDKIASRLAFVRSESGLFLGSCTDEYRLYACFDSLASVTEAKDQCQLLVERLRRDEGLMAPPFFVSGFGGGASSGLSMWP